MCYLTSCRQVITAGMGQIIDIDIKAVKIVMDLMGVSIEKQLSVLEKVRMLFHEFNDSGGEG